VAVAALASWHEAHEPARRAAAGAAIPAHARLETYSVLTRMPPPHRLAPTLVAELLERWFPSERTVVPSAALATGIVGRCSELGIDGGAVYDALVGLTAIETGMRLITSDVRAVRTYRRLDVEVELIR
jgi:hypothetical protein